MELNKDNSLGFALTTTLNTLRKNFNQKIKEFNVSSEQYAVMKLAQEHKNITPTELANLLARDKANISRIVESLNKKGLIKKEMINKKSYSIKLSNKGKEVLKEVDKVALKFQEKILSIIGEKDYKCIIEKLNLIRKNF